MRYLKRKVENAVSVSEGATFDSVSTIATKLKGSEAFCVMTATSF
jgi:hypothetical protein